MVAQFGVVWAAIPPRLAHPPHICVNHLFLLELPKPPLPSTRRAPVRPPDPPQTRRTAEQGEDDEIHRYETDAGVRMREHRSTTERMTKAERRRAGCRRITAYWLADGFRMNLLANFLKREHNVVPRSFDEALYVAEEDGYPGSYFFPGRAPEDGFVSHDGYIARSLTSEPPIERPMHEPEESEVDGESRERGQRPQPSSSCASGRAQNTGGDVAEIVFFKYGVAVFFGFHKMQERNILEDVHGAGTLKGARVESEWKVEECHFALSNSAPPFLVQHYTSSYEFSSSPFRGRKSIHTVFGSIQIPVAPSHALTRACACTSTLLAHYESQAHTILQHPRTQALPRTRALALSRRDAMPLTGKLFTLRRDFVLGRNVLDVPSTFWEEASMGWTPLGIECLRARWFRLSSRGHGLDDDGETSVPSNDVHIIAYMLLFRIANKFHQEVISDPTIPNSLNRSIDFRAVTLEYDWLLTDCRQEWAERFEQDSDHSDAACEFHIKLLLFYTNYARLVMFSFKFQNAFQRGLEADDEVFFTRVRDFTLSCIVGMTPVFFKSLESAKTVVTVLVDSLVPTGYIHFAPDGA
ncbi:hypothetical protein F5148DRAFT_1152419 [Russula earlei]|uniref:Uncharacterized protein n=1 Tax=Russula earlei TaxID=71964 RepID=A0ACC0TXI4_9AGAM|nr:hypothetical protein F5148DRAFT_1152419 [Russula earlei]